ncbi:MAG TPA: ExbD/TolR family protein [Candidatus Polarisedimenticolaceae bacterium]
MLEGKGASAVKAGKPNSEINVTPLVDVMLVLLIIFMVVTPMLQSGPAVVLPKASDPPQKPETKEQVLVALAFSKQYYIGKDKNPLDETTLKNRLTEEFQRNEKAPVVIKADGRLTYGDVKHAMEVVRGAGFEEVGLIAEKRAGQ